MGFGFDPFSLFRAWSKWKGMNFTFPRKTMDKVHQNHSGSKPLCGKCRHSWNWFQHCSNTQSQRTSIGTEMCVSTSLALPWYSMLNLRCSNTMAPTQIQRNWPVLSCPLQTKRREISAHLWGFHGHFLVSCAATTSALTWQKGKFAGRQDVGEGREMSQEVDVSPKHHLQGRRKFCW